jgi:hypothetical protein
VLDPPKLGYWTHSSKWGLDGRPGKAETRTDSRIPRKHAATLDLDSGYLRTNHSGKAGQKPSGDLVSCWRSGGFVINTKNCPSSWSLPEGKGCDTCDTCKRLLPREVHRYTISLPPFHLRF